MGRIRTNHEKNSKDDERYNEKLGHNYELHVFPEDLIFQIQMYQYFHLNIHQIYKF